MHLIPVLNVYTIKYILLIIKLVFRSSNVQFHDRILHRNAFKIQFVFIIN